MENKTPDITHLKVQKTARIAQLGQLGPETRHVWIALHGWTETADVFIRNFRHLLRPDTVVIAPEALNRFYLGNEPDNVGTTWMTRRDRLHEIADYVYYLDQVYSSVVAQVPRSQFQLHLLGFSQGVATAWRWAMQGAADMDSLIIWAGTIPQEFTPTGHQRLKALHLYCAIGTRDKYVSVEKAKAYVAELKKLKPGLSYYQFDGNHRLDNVTLEKIQADMDALKQQHS